MVMSDGVHDNLHPAMLNITPKDLNLNFEDWQAAESVLNVEDVACNFRVKFLADLLENVPITPSNIVNRVIEHSIEITKSSREFMQENPGKRLPRDYGLYPGKMDHTTCLVFRVGRGDDPVAPIGTAFVFFFPFLAFPPRFSPSTQPTTDPKSIPTCQSLSLWQKAPTSFLFTAAPLQKER